MNGDLIIIALVIATAILTLMIAKLASFLRDFAEDTQYICYEMDHAADYATYRHWRGELRCHYLCLIPFVNGKNVMRLYNRIYHRADKVEKERKDSLVPLLLPSILGIFICMVCVCGITWAWYTASVETPTQKLTAAYYEVTVASITNPAGDTVALVDGKYSLKADTPYTVTLKASGSVKECAGYCLIQNTESGEKIYTQTFEPDESIVVRFTPTASGAYTFTGVWGSLPVGTENYLSHDNPEPSDTTEPAPAVPSDQPPEPFDGTYTVQSGDTLTAIADRFNTTVEKLQAYNNLADPSLIDVNQVLNIPPQDYVIPVPPAPEDSTPEPTEPPSESSQEPVHEPSEASQTKPVSDAVTEPINSEPVNSEVDTENTAV